MRLALCTVLLAFMVAAPAHAHSTMRMSLKAGWRAIHRQAQKDAEGYGGKASVDSCVHRAGRYQVRCRITQALGLADDGRMVCEEYAAATRHAGAYHVSPRDYQDNCKSVPDGREPCTDANSLTVRALGR